MKKKRLYFYVVLMNHPNKVGTFITKAGQTVAFTREEAIKYATNETVGKVRGLIHKNDVIYCMDHTEHAEENGYFMSGGNFYDKYDDFLRIHPALPTFDGVIKNDAGGSSREVVVHKKGMTRDEIIESWKSGLKIALKGSNSKTLPVYEPYFYKVFIENIFMEMLCDVKSKTKEIDFMLELAPRFGKTSWIITLLDRLFKEGYSKLCVLPSYWLSSLSSFQKEIGDWYGFDEMIYLVKRGDDIKSVLKEHYGKRMIVVEASLHNPNFKKIFKPISKLPKREKITIMDEADFGTWKHSQKELIDFLRCRINVYMSGTGSMRMASGLKNLDNRIIQFSYTDMLLTRSGQHPLFFD